MAKSRFFLGQGQMAVPLECFYELSGDIQWGKVFD